MDTPPTPPSPARPPLNAALICDYADPAFMARALSGAGAVSGLRVVSDAPGFVAALPVRDRLLFQTLRLDAMPPDAYRVAAILSSGAGPGGAPPPVCIDMSWAVGTVQGTRRIEFWSEMAERLNDLHGVSVVSCYDKDLMIEDQMQAAFRAHRQFLAPSGLYDNPYWLPTRLATGATQDQQLAFLLGRVVPDYAGVSFFDPADRMMARGASPDWLSPRPHVTPTREAERWEIHCLGQLRVYRSGRERVDWHSPGSSPNKTRTLFAYLLTSGEKGAHVDRIGELLWPDSGTEAGKRARLHHTVAMLRKSLGSKDSVLRSGEYYRLNPPPGSWMDITSFEQLCRRGLSLAMAGKADEALRLYDTARRLYQGDLFADLPMEYVQSDQDDWCLPKRTWLRDMATKVHRDASVILRGLGRLREAQDHCQEALKLDPMSEEANSEAMRVFHAQGRLDAMARQYRQYQAALAAAGDSTEFTGIKALYRALTSGR